MILDPPRGTGLDAEVVLVSVMEQGVQCDPLAELSRFRGVFYDCLTGRRDALFERHPDRGDRPKGNNCLTEVDG